MEKFCLIALAMLMGGCMSVGELKPPSNVPPSADYRIGNLEARANGVTATLDLDECTAYAAYVTVGLSGVPSVVGHFPVQEIVENEFRKVIADNFCEVKPGDDPTLEMKIVSERLVVKRSWSRATAEMTFEIQVVDPNRDRRPYFRKKYCLHSESVQKNKDEIPVCVYACIQDLALGFTRDIAKNAHAMMRMRTNGKAE